MKRNGMSEEEKEGAQEIDSYSILNRYLTAIRKRDRLRTFLGIMLIVILLGIAGYFGWELIPQTYTLRISGGEVLGNRHYLVMVLKKTAVEKRVVLLVEPVTGSFAALEKVSRNELDVAFIQGGLDDKIYPDVVHISTIEPEVLHLLVKPGINTLEELKGKSVNTGSVTGGTRVVVEKIMKFSELQSNIDYRETNYTLEELSSLHSERLPDAVFILSTLPSHFAEFFIKNRGYRIIDIPFPNSLALRYGWVNSEYIPAYTYNIIPPIPDHNINTVGINIHIVGNSKTDSKAVFELLEVLYSHEHENELPVKYDPKTIKLHSGYPLSRGTLNYLNKDNPVFSISTLTTIQDMFATAMAVISALLVVFKFFTKLPEPEKASAGE